MRRSLEFSYRKSKGLGNDHVSGAHGRSLSDRVISEVADLLGHDITVRSLSHLERIPYERCMHVEPIGLGLIVGRDLGLVGEPRRSFGFVAVPKLRQTVDLLSYLPIPRGSLMEAG
jgi:hypothetical protein